MKLHRMLPPGSPYQAVELPADSSKGTNVPSGSGSRVPAMQMRTWRVNTTVRQIYLSTWAAMCLLGMILIAGSFIVERINDEVRIGYWKSSHVSTPTNAVPTAGIASAKMYRTSQNTLQHQGAGKMTAMVLCFVYASLAWTMSNGIVLNPRRAA